MIREWYRKLQERRLFRKWRAQVNWYMDTSDVVNLAPDNLSAAVYRAKERNESM